MFGNISQNCLIDDKLEDKYNVYSTKYYKNIYLKYHKNLKYTNIKIIIY